MAARHFIAAIVEEAVVVVAAAISKVLINPTEALPRVTRDRTTHLRTEMGLGSLLHLLLPFQVGVDGVDRITSPRGATEIHPHTSHRGTGAVANIQLLLLPLPLPSHIALPLGADSPNPPTMDPAITTIHHLGTIDTVLVEVERTGTMTIITIVVTTVVERVAAEVIGVAVEVQVETITEVEGVTTASYGEDNFLQLVKACFTMYILLFIQVSFHIGFQGSMRVFCE